MSYAVKPLKTQQLSTRVSAVSSLNDRVRDRLRQEKATNKISEREIAELIQWTQSKVAQKLSGRTPITLDEMEALCFALSIPPTEAVRDPGLEFCADMTPTELRVLERIRHLDPTTRDAFFQLLSIRTSSKPDRYAKLPKQVVKNR